MNSKKYMKDMTEYKTVILDITGNCAVYSKNKCMSNLACVSEYSKSHFGHSSTLKKFIKQGNIVFLNNNGFVEAYMPKQISDEQLYKLDLMVLKMAGLKRMKVRKFSEEEFVLEEKIVLEDKIDERFSSEVIQSYYNKPKEKKK